MLFKKFILDDFLSYSYFEIHYHINSEKLGLDQEENLEFNKKKEKKNEDLCHFFVFPKRYNTLFSPSIIVKWPFSPSIIIYTRGIPLLFVLGKDSPYP